MTSRTAKLLALAVQSNDNSNYSKNTKFIANEFTIIKNGRDTDPDKSQDDEEYEMSFLSNKETEDPAFIYSSPKGRENVLLCPNGANKRHDDLLHNSIEDMEIVFADETNVILSEFMDYHTYEIVDFTPEAATIEMQESEIVETAKIEKETSCNDKEGPGLIEPSEVGEPSTEGDPNWEPDIAETNSNDEGENNGSQLSGSESDNTKEGRKRNKRHHVKPDNWVKNSNQRKREKGSDYVGRKKVEGKWKYDVPKTQKTMKERCNCAKNRKLKKLQCFLLTETERGLIFRKFWKMSWDEKRIYVTSLVEKKTTSRSRNRKVENQSRRSCTYNYFLQKIDGTKLRVCQTMFANTLAMQPWTLVHWLNSYIEKTRDDKTEKALVLDESEPRKSCETKDDETSQAARRKYLKEFFDSLPKMESHYCRSSSSKLYLEPTWKSKTELFTQYTSWMAIHHPDLRSLSISVFHNMFSDLNLSLFVPKKDECDLCIAHKTGNIEDEEYQNHLIRKNDARDEKEKDKSSGDEFKVYTLDKQAVLLCPKSNVSLLYYKTKLAVHNYTVFDLKTKEGFCFLWHESEGGLVASVYASILVKFLSSEIEKYAKQYYIIYSDGCTSQNRNVIMSNALLNLALLKKVTIMQKYLERGHTQMECDSMHSRIEVKLKNSTINVPADYVKACQKARKNPKPYNVEYLNHTFFKDFTSLKYNTTIRPGIQATVNAIRQLKYNPDGTIEFKLNHVDDWSPLCNRKTAKTSVSQQPIDLPDLPNLYTSAIPIKKTKYDHLQSLKSTMPSDYHGFYDRLPHNHNN